MIEFFDLVCEPKNWKWLSSIIQLELGNGNKKKALCSFVSVWRKIQPNTTFFLKFGGHKKFAVKFAILVTGFFFAHFCET